MDRPKLSIIIINYKVRDLLRENLTALYADDFASYLEVIVVDNGSGDGTGKMIREHFPQTKLILNDYNSGSSHAVNQALRVATGEVLLWLNPDMKVHPGCLQKTHDTLIADKTMGIFGAKLIDPSGKPIGSVRRDPSFLDQLAIVLKLPHFFPRLVDHYFYKEFDYEISQEVPQVRGSYFAFRRELMELVGGFDESFFIWFEEVDYCRRVREAGYRVYYCAEAVCEDLVGQSFRQVCVRKKQRLLMRSLVTYFQKWHGAWKARCLWLLTPFAIGAGVIVDVLSWLQKKRV